MRRFLLAAVAALLVGPAAAQTITTSPPSLTAGLPSAATTTPYCGTGSAGAASACISGTILPNTTAATTQTTSDTSTDVATDAFAHNAINVALPSATTANAYCATAGAGVAAACTSALVLPNGATATTQTTSDTTTDVATDAFAHNALNTGIPSAATTAPECGSGGAGAVAACSSTMVLPNGTTATTQATGSNDTKVATDGLVVAAIPTGATTAPRCGSGAAGSDSSCTGTLVLPNGTTATTQATSSNDTKVATDGLVFAALPSLATTAPDCGTGTAGARQACTGTLVLPSGTTATTQTGGTNNTTVATTAYANSAVSTAIPSAATTAPECGSGGAGAVAACGATMVLPNGAAATLQTVSDNSTKVATDSFVAQAIPSAATTAPECGGGAVGLVGACSATMVLPSGTTATLQSAGDNSTKVATDSYVYQALSTVASLTTTTGSATLSAAQYSQPLVKQTGTLSANVTYTVPNSWLAVWENLSTGAFTTTVKTSAGTGVIVPQGQTVALLADGTNVVVVNAENVQIFTSSGTATLPTNFTGAWIKAAAGGGGGGGGANVVNSTGAGSGAAGAAAALHARQLLHRGGIRLVAVGHDRCWRHARRRRGGVQQRERQWRWQRRHDDDRHAGPARRRRRWPGRRLDGRERRRGRRHDRPERQGAVRQRRHRRHNALGVTNATLGGAAAAASRWC